MNEVITFTVECQWDEEAHVWYVSTSNVPGLVAEAATTEQMRDILSVRVPELIQLNMPNIATNDECEVPLELILKRHSNLRIAC